MWLWHSAEELEHKSVAFDVYKAAGGSDEWRKRWFRRVTLMFLGDLMRQTVDNLRHEKQLWKWSTWKSAARILLSRDGLLRGNVAGWRSYLRADFHPAQQDSTLSERWLVDNRAQYTPVGAAAEPSAAASAA
jgi:predicted metal-dependent hydrolase